MTVAFTLQNHTGLTYQSLNDTKVLNWLSSIDEDALAIESSDLVSKIVSLIISNDRLEQTKIAKQMSTLILTLMTLT